MSIILLLLGVAGSIYAFDHSGEVSTTMSPLLIHSMLEQNKFIRYVESLPVHNTTKNTMMMVARIRKRLPENNQYNTTTFLSYIAHFDKTYSDEIEAAEKYKNVKYSMEEVEVQQKQNPQAVMGLTQFADITEGQFLAHYTSGKKTAKTIARFVSRYAKEPLSLPKPRVRVETSVDWRKKGKVTPVKDQGTCGCCYAFAAVAVIESQYAIKTGKMLDLSEQQAISCTYKDPKYSGNNGCNGGHSDAVFEYVTKNGLTTAALWPNESPKTLQIPKCVKKKSAFHVNNHKQLLYKDESGMEEAVRTIGPIVTYVDANPTRFYRSGVISSKGAEVTHAVTIVGFTKDYWIVKNSWGRYWGEEGYFRVQKGSNALRISEFTFAAYL